MLKISLASHKRNFPKSFKTLKEKRILFDIRKLTNKFGMHGIRWPSSARISFTSFEKYVSKPKPLHIFRCRGQNNWSSNCIVSIYVTITYWRKP